MTDLLLPSEQIIVESPLSYRGAIRRWERRHPANDVLAVLLLLGWCTAVTAWYVAFGATVVPYRLIRRRRIQRRIAELRRSEAIALPPVAA